MPSDYAIFYLRTALPYFQMKEASIMENNTTPAPVKEKVKLTDRIKNALGQIPGETKKRVLRLVILVVVILLVTNPNLIPFLPTELKYVLTRAMTSLLGNVSDISSVLPLNWIVVIKLAVMVLLLQILKEVCLALLNSLKPKTGKGKTLLNVALSGFNYLLAILGIFWGLAILGVNVSTLFASMGILALIVGFGAEKLIADVVTGLFLIFENEYNVGDIIEVDGYRGTVSEIGVRTTSITDAGGNVKIFNNSDVRNITNLSNLQSTAVCDLDLPASMPLSVAEAVLEAILPKIQKENADIFPVVPTYEGVQALSGSSMTLRITATVAEADRFKAARIINRYLKEAADSLRSK